MKNFNLSAVLYTNKNLDLMYRVHKICKETSITLVNCFDFVDLTIKTVHVKPQIIFCDINTLNFTSEILDMLINNHEFEGISIIFIGNQDKLINYKSYAMEKENLLLLKYDEMFSYLNSVNVKMSIESYKQQFNSFSQKTVFNLVNDYLNMLGFSPKQRGFIFLREIVKNIVNCGGVVSTLVGDCYPIIAVKYKTSIINIERNIRNAISIAWEKYGKENWNKVFSNIGINNELRPTNREFIMLCADYISNELTVNCQQAYA